MRTFEEYEKEILDTNEKMLNARLARVKRRLEILAVLPPCPAISDWDIMGTSAPVYRCKKEELVGIRMLLAQAFGPGMLLEERFKTVQNAKEYTIGVYLTFKDEPEVLGFRYIDVLPEDSPCHIVNEVTTYSTLVCDVP